MNTRWWRTLGIGAVLAGAVLMQAAGAEPTDAADVRVCPSGCAYNSIAAAVAAARAGDMVRVAAGTYAGPVAIDKAVTLRGAGAEQTTVAGLVTIGVQGVADITGLTFTRGRQGGEDGGIDNHGRLTLRDSVVRGASARSHGGRQPFYGGGIYNTGTLTVERSTISQNHAGACGGGIYNTGTATIERTTISGNDAKSGGGIGNEGTLTLVRSTVTGNYATLGAGGIANFGRLELDRTDVQGNRAGSEFAAAGASGGGIANQGELQARHGTISANVGLGNGVEGAGLFNSGTAVLDHTTVSDNNTDGDAAAPRHGGGIANRGSLTLLHVTVEDNTGTGHGGGIYISGEDSTTVVRHSRVTSNRAASGGGIYRAGGTVTLEQSRVTANAPSQCEPSSVSC
jgi:hypothetical protein